MRSISGDTLAIDRKYRARLPSIDITKRPANQRVCDFDDICIPWTPEEAMFEASRCVQCPDPAPCVEACPLHNDIPSAMWLIEQGEFLQAAALYRQTSSIPEICGRVCPQEVLCEGSCSHIKSHASVLTGNLGFVTATSAARWVSSPVGSLRANGWLSLAGPAGMAVPNNCSRWDTP
jgi:NADPH-dependent glutamate synthase beta subunit-like oxidoreductase